MVTTHRVLLSLTVMTLFLFPAMGRAQGDLETDWGYTDDTSPPEDYKPVQMYDTPDDAGVDVVWGAESTREAGSERAISNQSLQVNGQKMPYQDLVAYADKVKQQDQLNAELQRHQNWNERELEIRNWAANEVNTDKNSRSIDQIMAAQQNMDTQLAAANAAATVKNNTPWPFSAAIDVPNNPYAPSKSDQSWISRWTSSARNFLGF